jgi:S-formylglutathione hydrolase FrmB
MVGLFFVLAGASSAEAARIVTWETRSRFVNPAEVRFNPSPPGARERPPGLRVNVYLPDGYNGKRRFPVLYLLHNLYTTFEGWANPQQGDVMNVAKGFPAIIVMPEGARGWYANWWNGGARGNPGWERYHLEELIRLAERRLRIRRGRRWHAIAGPSMGGQGAAFYASQRPGYFGAAGLFSAPLSIQRPEWPGLGMESQGENVRAVFGDPSEQRFYWTGHNPIELIDNLARTRLYVTVGDGRPAPNELGKTNETFAEAYLRTHVEEFMAAARAAGLDVTYEPRQGIHDWPYYRQHLAAAIRWGFFEPVKRNPSTWAYRTVAQRGQMWGFRFRFAAPPETVESFTRQGRRLAGEGGGSVSIRTPAGCEFKAALPFEREVPPACTAARPAAISAAVRPRRTRAGARTRFRFRAATPMGPLPAATVRFAGRRLRMNTRGRATIVVRLRPGRHRARITKPGLRSDAVTVTVRRGSSSR